MPSIKAEFSFNDEDFERVKQSIKRLGDSSEEVINNYLHNVAGEDITESITNYIPVSKKGNRHAKHNNWNEQENYNLAVTIGNKSSGKKSFYYLYYVATGTGTSVPSKKKTGVGGVDFMKKGIDNE